MKTGKRILAGISAVALVAAIGAPSAFAMGGYCNGAARGGGNAIANCINQVCGQYSDANGDGVCDNAGSGYGAGNGNCTGASNGGFVDEDGDGACDNAGNGNAAGNGAHNGTGTGTGGGHHGSGNAGQCSR
jgi:hypothetical protein